MSDLLPPASDLSLSIIVAIGENGVIGRDGQLPWQLSADLRRFKRLTMGHPIVMGRRTWESIGRPLPGRTSIVVTRQEDFTTNFPEVIVAADLPSALKAAAATEGGQDNIFVIGGAELYAAALPMADWLYVTRVKAAVEGDARFPDIDWSRWQLIEQEHGTADDRNEYDYAFEVYNLIGTTQEGRPEV